MATAALKDFDIDADGCIDVHEMTKALHTLESTPALKSGFDDLGVPIPSLRKNLDLCEKNSDGHIDVGVLVDMVKTGDHAPTRDDIFLLRHRIYMLEIQNEAEHEKLGTDLTAVLTERMDHMEMKLTALMSNISTLISRGY